MHKNAFKSCLSVIIRNEHTYGLYMRNLHHNSEQTQPHTTVYIIRVFSSVCMMIGSSELFLIFQKRVLLLKNVTRVLGVKLSHDSRVRV